VRCGWRSGGGVRAGLSPEEAAVAAGAGRHAGRLWMAAAGGVKGNGPAAVSGRFLAGWEREEIAVGLAAGLSCRAIAARLAPGRSASTVSREVICPELSGQRICG
jgi:Helix-turn-helix domain